MNLNDSTDPQKRFNRLDTPDLAFVASYRLHLLEAAFQLPSCSVQVEDFLSGRNKLGGGEMPCPQASQVMGLLAFSSP
jgi:hypothetical protein